MRYFLSRYWGMTVLVILMDMKIAMIIRRLNVKGGAQRQALELARELQKRGHTITMYTFAYSPKDCFEDLLDGLKVVVWGAADRKGAFFRGSFFEENRRAKELALHIDKDIDLLHPHDQVSYRVAAYYKKCVRNVPSVWMMNDMPTRRYAAWYGRRMDPHFRVPALKRIAHWLMDAYDIQTFIRVQDAIAVLDHFNREQVRRFLGRDAVVVRSGLDISAFQYIERTPPSRTDVQLLTTGIFMRHRRFEDAIEAVKILVDRGIGVSLTVIGDQDNDRKYYEEMKRLVEEKKLTPRVSFLGRVSEEELVRAYREHHVFVFANDPQTWGLAVFEAMACGTPVVVSRGAGAHEVLQDRENALLVRPREPREIADTVENLVGDPALYSILSRKGRVFVEQNLGWDKYADAMEALFMTTIGKR